MESDNFLFSNEFWNQVSLELGNVLDRYLISRLCHVAKRLFYNKIQLLSTGIVSLKMRDNNFLAVM